MSDVSELIKEELPHLKYDLGFKTNDNSEDSELKEKMQTGIYKILGHVSQWGSQQDIFSEDILKNILADAAKQYATAVYKRKIGAIELAKQAQSDYKDSKEAIMSALMKQSNSSSQRHVASSDEYADTDNSRLLSQGLGFDDY
ncbi:MAG: hypothetical protein HRU07_06665 [Nitrosopumilus sp.]|nr:hypothetical protein [Nitrosopumilus sp.]NRA05823.1 hypothetical protein [Nitrosopumilus sp.]